MWGSLWLGLLLAIGPAQAIAQDHITARGYFEDTSRQQTIESVRDASFSDFDGVLSQGYGASALWVRLQINPAVSRAAPDDTLYLRIRPAYLDDLQIYDPYRPYVQATADKGPQASDSGPVRPILVGDRHALDSQAEPATAFVVPLVAGPEARDVYIRLVSTSTRLAHFEVLTGTELRRDTSRIDQLSALYLTIIGIFLVWGIVQALTRPSVLLVTFVVFQACTLLFSLGMLGYVRFYLSGYLSSPWIDFSTSLPAVTATGAVMFFCVQLLKEISYFAWYRTIEKAILLSYTVLIAAMFFGAVRPVLTLNMLMVLIVPISLLVFSLLISKAHTQLHTRQSTEARLPRYVVVGFFAVSCFFTLMTALPALGILPGAEISLYIVLFYSLTSGCLMVSVLYYRGLILLRGQTALAAEAGNQKLRAEQERKSRLERERLLAMLGHELKTPLATVRMLLMDREIPEKTAQRIQSSITDMAQVVERTVQTSQVEDGAIEARMADCEIVTLLSEVVNTLSDRARLEIVRAEGLALKTRTDPYLLQVILRNLLDNALKYSAPDTPVRIVIDSVNAANRWSITVSNRPGHAGWPDRQRVFEKYYRSPTASHRSGSGLGLYMIQGLAKTLGGRVVYEPDAQWVRFRLEVTHSPMKES
ncbi:MAG: sensor histidine kinase [Burkholderiaceae bacterium]